MTATLLDTDPPATAGPSTPQWFVEIVLGGSATRMAVETYASGRIVARLPDGVEVQRAAVERAACRLLRRGADGLLDLVRTGQVSGLRIDGQLLAFVIS